MSQENPIKKLSFEEIKSSRPSIDDLSFIKRLPVVTLVENIRSLYNVGSIFRTSDGVLLEKLYLCGYTGYPPRKEIDKTSLGSTESVPWEHDTDPFNTARVLKEKGYHLVCLEHTGSSINYTEADYHFPMCLVIGNEVEGVSDGLVSLCDMAVEIPMRGIKQSLNAAVAYGIVIYHILDEYNKRQV